MCEFVLKLERLVSIPDLNRFVATGTHQNAPVGVVVGRVRLRGVSLVDALHQASTGFQILMDLSPLPEQRSLQWLS